VNATGSQNPTEPACGQTSEARLVDRLRPDDWLPLSEARASAGVFTACAGCPLRRRCLRCALDHREVGIWAGTTTDDRRHARAVPRNGLAIGMTTESVVDQLLALAAGRATMVGSAALRADSALIGLQPVA
jgi:hypothetical protein